MLRKTTSLLLLGFCLFLLTVPFFAQQRAASPYPVLEAKKNFLDAEEFFKNRADFVLAEQLYREVYERLSPKQVMEKAYVGLLLAFTLNNLNKQNEALPLLVSIEKTLSGQDKETELLLADLYTYRAKSLAKNIATDKALEWNDKAMAIKKKYYPEAHPKLGESYAVYIYVHNYFTKNMELTSRYLDLEKAVVTQHPDEYPKYEQVAFHYNMAEYYSRQGEYLKASTNGKKAIQLLEPFKHLHPRYLANCYAMMANVHLRMEDAKPAIQYMQEALSHQVVNRKDSLDRALVYTNIGYAYSLDGEMETATEYLKQALSYYDERDTLYRAYSMNKLAEHYLNYPDVEANEAVLDSAYAYMNITIALLTAKNSKKNTALANPYSTMGDYFEIVGDYDNAILSYHNALINSLPAFSDKSPHSLPFAQECLVGYLTEPILFKKAYALFNKAKKTNSNELLLQSFSINQLIDSINLLKKKYYTDEYSLINAPNIQKGYGVMLQLLFRIGEIDPNANITEKAFKYMERVKGNVLLRNLAELKHSESFGIPDSLLSQSKKIGEDINSYLLSNPEMIVTNFGSLINSNDNLFKLLEKKEKIDAVFQKNYPQYYQVRFQLPPPTFKEIQEQLNDHALIEFYWAINDIFALYINKGEAKLYQIPIDNQLTHIIDSHVKYLKENSKTDFLNFQKNAHILYSKLLAPIFKEDIPKKLIIVPDGLLAAIPFETLLSAESHSETINYRDLPYLIHQTAISYAYSTNTLLQAYDKSNLLKSPSLLAFSFSDEKGSDQGDSILNKFGLFPLAGAVEEVKNLRNLFPPDKFTSFYGPTATKEQFFNQVQQYDLIHLALHAQSDHSNRFNNRIFFHPDKTEEDNEQFICYAHELYGLNTPPRLVVLSACNTGAGTNYAGEGTYSTARGFLYAGTPSVVMSLWPLSDQASKVINGDFYKAILRGLPLDEALRQAKLSFISSSDEWTAHPSRWAALNVVGSSKPIVKPSISYAYGLAALLSLLLLTGMVWWWRKKNSASTSTH
jgi:CHAT domain-containing protein